MLACSIVSSKNKRLSSANKRWEILGDLQQMWSSFSVLFSISFLMSQDKPSTTNRNKYGERGSLCRIPCVGVEGSNKCPLKRIEYRMMVTQAITHRIHWLWKPNFAKTPSKNLQSTQSYALAISNLYAQKFLRVADPVCIEWMHSNAISTLSVIRHPGIKALSIGDMISCNIGRRRLTRHLDRDHLENHIA
jgi:hypothetical protein